MNKYLLIISSIFIMNILMKINNIKQTFSKIKSKINKWIHINIY